MEVCSAAASKRSAAQRLRALYGFDELVGFGDNLNDLPLFEACDRCYAVQNASDAVKPSRLVPPASSTPIQTTASCDFCCGKQTQRINLP